MPIEISKFSESTSEDKDENSLIRGNEIIVSDSAAFTFLKEEEEL